MKLYLIETRTWAFFACVSSPEEAMARAKQAAPEHAEFGPSVHTVEADTEAVEFYCAS